MSEPPIDSPETLPDWVFPWPRLEPDWTRAALLVVDMQNYCCNPGAGLGPMLAERHPDVAAYTASRLEILIPTAARLIAAFRQADRAGRVHAPRAAPRRRKRHDRPATPAGQSTLSS